MSVQAKFAAAGAAAGDGGGTRLMNRIYRIHHGVGTPLAKRDAAGQPAAARNPTTTAQLTLTQPRSVQDMAATVAASDSTSHALLLLLLPPLLLPDILAANNNTRATCALVVRSCKGTSDP